MTKVREAYSDKLGDLVNLDFAPKGAVKPAEKPGAAPAAKPAAPVPPAAVAKPKVSAADLAKAAAAKRK
jgi:hypothetical protein